MYSGYRGNTVPVVSLHVDSLAETCGSEAALIKWATSAFEQRDEVVKLICAACEADQGPEGAPPIFRAYAYCMKHATSEGKKCPVSWRIYGVAGIGSGGTMHIRRRGEKCPAGSAATMIQHAEFPRIVKGMQVGERKKLKATGVETPLRSLAQLYEEAGDDGERAARVPNIASLRGQRKKHLMKSGVAGAAVPTSTSMIIWKNFVSSIAFEKEKWKVAQPFRLFSVTIDEVDAPPICLLVCKAFLQYIESWKNTRTSGAVCCDTTWKLNVAQWGLFVIAGMATHFRPKDGHRRCMALPFSMTFGPKEDIPTLDWAIKGTFAFYHKHFGVSLKPFINVAMWDATLAGAAVHEEGGAFAGVDYARDLRHQLSNAIEIAPSKCNGDRETKGVAACLVTGSIEFSAFNLWTGTLFHDHWEHVMARLIAEDQTDLVTWVQDYVLFWNHKVSKWDAHWRTALMSERHPGESTYLPQVLESLHDTIKDALPEKMHLKDPSQAIAKLGPALEAVAKSREWIAPATGRNSSQKWVFTERLEDDIAKQTRIDDSFPPRCVKGPRKRTRRVMIENDARPTTLTFDALERHMPDNIKSASVNVDGVGELYVVPLCKKELVITDEIIAATKQLLFPDNKNAFETAKEDMRITIPYNGTQLYSLSGSKRFFSNICPVFVKTDDCVVCGCKDARVCGECAHENYVRYMILNLRKQEFAPMIHLTTFEENRTRNMFGNIRGSPGGMECGPADVPAKAARLTMEDIREADKQRNQKHATEEKGKDTFRKRMLRRTFSSPERESPEQARKKAKIELLQRAKNMRYIKNGLRRVRDGRKVFKALQLCLDSRLGVKDSLNEEYELGKTVGEMAEDRSLTESNRALARKVRDKWFVEYKIYSGCPLATIGS